MSVYTPKVGLEEDIKRLFWKELDEVIQCVPQLGRLFIADNCHGRIGRDRNGYETHGGFGFRERNSRGCLLRALCLHASCRLLTPISRKTKTIQRVLRVGTLGLKLTTF